MRTRLYRQAKSAPVASIVAMPSGLLLRKCACGGIPGPTGQCTACRRKRLSIQPKLTINQSSDKYELEADRVADQVMRMPEPRLQRQTEPDDEDDELLQTKPLMQRKVAGQAIGHTAPPIVHEVLNSPGQPLDPTTRDFMEPRFGHDFSRVRVHTDSKAAESARAVDALAYTVGRDVVFSPGQFVPQSRTGKRLLAHELTHVVQQCRFSGLAQQISEPSASQGTREQEAEQVAEGVLTGSPVAVSGEAKGIQFYGHSPSCKDDLHLKPFIWPGHDHARKAVGRAIEELKKSPLHSTVSSELRRLFGKDGITKAKKIKENFGPIQSALGEEYHYHCANPCEKPNKGARAWTDRSGNKDITLCFDIVAGFSVPAAAWIIIHENVHRGLNVWPNPHPWDAKDFNACTGVSGGQLPTNDTKLLLTNPDSYACLASRMWFPL